MSILYAYLYVASLFISILLSVYFMIQDIPRREPEWANANHPCVIDEIRMLSQHYVFGIEKGRQFIPLEGLKHYGNKLMYKNGECSVSSRIDAIKGTTRARWLNHLCFKNDYGHVILLKDYVSQVHNLVFTQN